MCGAQAIMHGPTTEKVVLRYILKQINKKFTTTTTKNKTINNMKINLRKPGRANQYAVFLYNLYFSSCSLDLTSLHNGMLFAHNKLSLPSFV